MNTAFKEREYQILIINQPTHGCRLGVLGKALIYGQKEKSTSYLPS